jgi:hypothetical protein
MISFLRFILEGFGRTAKPMRVTDKADIQHLGKNSSYGEVSGFINHENNRVYAWKGEDGFHGDVIGAMRRSPKKISTFRYYPHERRLEKDDGSTSSVDGVEHASDDEFLKHPLIKSLINGN